MHGDTLHASQGRDAGHRNKVGPERDKGRLGLVGERKGIVEASYKKKSVNTGTPFMVIAQAYNWFLRFFDAEIPIRCILVKILKHIPALCLIMLSLQIKCVFGLIMTSNIGIFHSCLSYQLPLNLPFIVTQIIMSHPASYCSSTYTNT